MTKKIPRLQLRNHTYYIRIVVPNSIKDLVKKKEVRYSLNTNNYFTALSKLRIESAKIEMYFNFVKELKMKLDGRSIILTDEELDKVLIYRLRQIDDFYENNFNRAHNNKKDFFEDIGLFTQKKVDEYNEKHRDPNVPDTDDDAKDETDYGFIKETIQNLLFEYLEWLKERPNTQLSIYNFVEKICQQRGLFFQITQNDENSKKSSQMLDFYHNLLDIDKMIKEKIGLVPIKRLSGPDNPKIIRLEMALQQQRRKELLETPTILSKWIDVFNDMIRPAKHSKSVSDAHLKTKKQCLETIFELIDKQYVEQITFDDCKKINKLIYLIPKKWKEKYPNKNLLEVLLPEDADLKEAISASSVRKYITIFQEFLKYCRKQRLINNDIADILTKPQVDKNKNVWQPFEPEELKQIFNKKTYFKREKGKDNHKYWIPLISLYSGMRLNEICQIRLNDIKTEKNIDYIQITDNGETQSVKNYASTRRVPIHPILKELGLMEQIKFAKKQKQDRLFYSLTYSTKNRYAGSMSNAFRYYMDKVIKIKNPKKVFHSFRHTARGTYINYGVSEEFVNILCGWEGIGAGAKNYLHREKVDIKKLDKAIRKLKYPEVERILFSK